MLSSWGSDCWHSFRWISSLLLISIILLSLETEECAGRPRLTRDSFGIPIDSKLQGDRKVKYYINTVPDIRCPERKRMGHDGICRDQNLTRGSFSKHHRHNHGVNSVREDWRRHYYWRLEDLGAEDSEYLTDFVLNRQLDWKWPLSSSPNPARLVLIYSSIPRHHLPKPWISPTRLDLTKWKKENQPINCLWSFPSAPCRLLIKLQGETGSTVLE